jgi:protein TonB
MNAFLFSLALSIAAHGGVLLLYRAYDRVALSNQVLPYGWAAEFEGAGDEGAKLIGFDTTIDPRPSAPASETPRLSAPPLAEVEPPTPAVRPAYVDPAAGTVAAAEFSNIPSDTAPPAVNFNRNPVLTRMQAEESNGTAGGNGAGTGGGSAAQPDARPVVATAAARGGKGSMGTGTGDGGGRIGVREGGVQSNFIRIRYPASAAAERLGGTVVLLFDVDARGKVKNVRLEQSSGHEVLDREALTALKRAYPPKTLWNSVDNRVPLNFSPPPADEPR